MSASSERDPITAWSVKYWSTDGVRKFEGCRACQFVQGDGRARYLNIPGRCNIERVGRDVFLTEVEALAAAEVKRVKRIASLKKQIVKFEGMKFVPRKDTPND